MSMKKIVFLLILLFFTPILFSQSNLISSFNLKTGNVYVYKQIKCCPNIDYPYIRCKILRDTLLNNKKYFLFDKFLYTNDSNVYIRFDTLTGNVFVFNDNSYCHYQDEDLIDSLRSDFHNLYQSCLNYSNFTSCDDTNSVNIFQNLWHSRQFRWQYVVSSYSQYRFTRYADEIGIIFYLKGSSTYTNSSYYKYDLKGCVLNGVLYGDTTNYPISIQYVSSEIPVGFKLEQNYPNPFNPKTNIRYQLKNNNSTVKLKVFDATGKHIIDLVSQEQNAGTYEVDFSGNDYATGICFYRMEVTDDKTNQLYTETKKMILLK